MGEPGLGCGQHQAQPAARASLERFPAKWIPVRVKKTRQNKSSSLRSDSIGTEKALANDRGRKAAHVTSLPADACESLLQAACSDRARNKTHGAFERMPPVSSLDIWTIQDVLATFVRLRTQRRHRENKSEKCDDFDGHVRPPPFDPLE